jgi:hypothetical protein
MRRFLYSRWFFLFLAVSCAISLFSDVAEDLWGLGAMINRVAIAMDAIILIMALWMFVDLQRRRPRDGGNSRR